MNNFIKRVENLAFLIEREGGSLLCNSLPDKKELHLAWESLLVSQSK